MPATFRLIAVELWTARVPRIARFAEHHWLVIHRPNACDRWEVWQSPDCCDDSWGHLHLNLKDPTVGVGNGPGRMLARWVDEDAEPLAHRIETAPDHYPWLEKYRVFPGPNSNTFVQWALGSRHTLGWRGVGRRFASRALDTDSSIASTRTSES